MVASIRNPVVVILGATGTGKTKLSLEIAKVFNGEIISADAMQLYQGLDIITNKASHEERQMCRHHMIDFLSPLKEDSTVVDYRDQAVPIIDSLLDEKKTPVIVGGTNYYIEALLWKHLVNKEDIKRAASQNTAAAQTKFPKLQDAKKIRGEIKDTGVAERCSEVDGAVCLNDESFSSAALSFSTSLSSPSSSSDDQNDKQCDIRQENDVDDDGDDDDNELLVKKTARDKYEQMSSEELYERLKEIDPESAGKIHPRDKRKVIRAVEVYDQHGIPMSQVYRAQRHTLSESSLSGPLRYKDCCVFWLKCEQDVLDKRLDDRVDKMLELGLLDELIDFHKQYNQDRLQQGKDADYTRGIFQSIGFKEFHDYLILGEQDRQLDVGKKALQNGIEGLKMVTRRYARYQNRWVKNRLLKRPCREAVLPVYGLDCTDVSLWEDNVSAPATTILKALRKDETSPIPPLPFEDEHKQVFEYKECKYCNVTTVLKHIWEAHTGSRRHKKNVQHYKKQMGNLSTHLDTYIQQKKNEEEQEKT